MAPENTLVYFDFTGRAELSRLIIKYAGEDFEDKRINRDEFNKTKSYLPYNQLPVLNIDGYGTLAQSLTIARYLANKYNLAGRTDIAKAQADEIVDTCDELGLSFFKVSFTSDPEEKKKKIVESIPGWKASFGNLEKRLTERGGQFMAGNQMTWADLSLYNIINTLKQRIGDESALKDCPKLNNLYDRVANTPNLKKYAAK